MNNEGHYFVWLMLKQVFANGNDDDIAYVQTLMWQLTNNSIRIAYIIGVGLWNITWK